MKKTVLLLLIIPFMFLESCNEVFDINGPIENIYTLNCILKNDGPVQYAIITKNTYTANGAPPPSNSAVPYIKGAKIKIFNNDSTFVMRDTTIQSPDSGNTEPVNCYYLKNLILKPGKSVSIEAALPDGNILKSAAQVPDADIKTIFSFPQSVKGSYVDTPYFFWNFNSNNILSLPQLIIFYKKYEDGIYVDKKMLVPISPYSVADDNGLLLPFDFKFSDYHRAYTTLETLNKTMKDISGSDPHKSNYIVTKVLFNVNSLDPDLSVYYSTYEVFSSSFSIKLRPTEYSNIKGGKGIFGVYYINYNKLTVDNVYIKTFGYQYIPSK